MTGPQDFDFANASSEALVDMGGMADVIAKRNTDVSGQCKVELRSRMDNLPKDETSTIAGEDFVAAIGKVPERVVAKEIVNADVIKLIGQEAFNAISTVSVSVLKTALSGKDFDALVGTAKTEGTRTVSFKELD